MFCIHNQDLKTHNCSITFDLFNFEVLCQPHKNRKEIQFSLNLGLWEKFLCNTLTIINEKANEWYQALPNPNVRNC